MSQIKCGCRGAGTRDLPETLSYTSYSSFLHANRLNYIPRFFILVIVCVPRSVYITDEHFSPAPSPYP